MSDGAGEQRTLVIVPTYNESGSIAEVAQRLFRNDPPIDLLVVDDGSPDGTAEIVRRLAEKDGRIHLMERKIKSGLGDAYVAGFGWALARDYGAIVEMDADLSHDPTQVPQLVAALGRADLAVGSRYVPGGKVVNWGWFRRFLSRFGNLYARFWLGFGVADSTSGFRAFRSSVLRGQDLSAVSSHGYAFQIEMCWRIHRAGGEIVEVPITFTERASGTSKMSRRIVVEALTQVTGWGLKERLRRKP